MKNKHLLFLLVLVIGAVSFTNCKKDKKLEIGQKYEGGIIFYLDGTGKHGMVCAESDQAYAGSIWWNGSYITTNATATTIGSGQSNTSSILSAQGIGTYAAEICDHLSLNNYSDWFFPSKEELGLMYSNLKVAGIGSFASDIYWSSSEIYNLATRETAWGMDFSSGSSFVISKNLTHRIRAARAF